MDKRIAKLVTVIKREYLERVRQRWFIVSSLLVPFMMVGLVAVPAWLSAKSITIADVSKVVIVDATGTDLGARVAESLFDSTHTNPAAARAHLRTATTATLAAAESVATRDVMERRASGFVVLDSSTATRRRARYEGRDATSIGLEKLIQRALRRGIIADRLKARGIDAAQIDSITSVDASISTNRLDENGRGGSGIAATIVGFGLAFLLYFSIIIFGQNVLRGVMEEKQTRVAEVVVSSVPAETLLAGKVIGVGGVGLTQQVLWYGMAAVLMTQIGPFLSRMSGGKAAAAGAGAGVALSALPNFSLGFIASVILFFVFGITFYCTLFAAVGAMVSSEQEAQQAAVPVTMLAVLSFIFVQPITLNPTSTLAHVMSWLPFSAPVVMPLRMTLLSIPWYEVAGSLLSVALGCVIATWFAARIYRVGLLMYGKKPSLRELVRWVRYSH
ncbi:MAG: ABC transporter permease [Gemmatimonadaceae bacterium]